LQHFPSGKAKLPFLWSFHLKILHGTVKFDNEDRHLVISRKQYKIHA